MNLAVAGSVIGRSLPMQLLRERAAFSQIKRLPVLASSMVALEISLGREASLDFQDYLNGALRPASLWRPARVAVARGFLVPALKERACLCQARQKRLPPGAVGGGGAIPQSSRDVPHDNAAAADMRAQADSPVF